MNQKISTFVIISISSFFIIGCKVQLISKKTPKSKSYGKIDNVDITDGNPIKSEPLYVISDRGNNPVWMAENKEEALLKVKFLQPLLVLKYRPNKGLVKVAEFNQDALFQKLAPSEVKAYGWMDENQLLMWSNTVRNSNSGYNVKAVLVPNSAEVIMQANKYLKKDSVVVYTSPELSTMTKKKLSVGQIVYIYKKAENGNRVLIGKSPKIQLDSIQNSVYGWVSTNMISIWGDRTGLKVSSDYESFLPVAKVGVTKTTNNKIDSLTQFLIPEADDRTPIENMIATVPTKIDSTNKAKFFTNALDYNKNFIYNVLGEPLYYKRYKEIIKKNKTLNIVFTIDISNEVVENTAIAKSLFQELRLNLNKYGYYKKVKFGAVLYKKSTCGKNINISELSPDFEKISDFLNLQTSEKNCSSIGAQPLDEGLDAAGKMLIPVKDETNVVVIVGATSSSSVGVSSTINSLSESNAKIISYQSISGASDAYNNFVLLSENIVTTTAKNISELQKEKVINQNTIFNKNNYSLQLGQDGVYYLDYPKTSMTQGYVIYPKKGEVNSNGLLATSIDALITQVTKQNKEIDSTLTTYFKSINGTSRTDLKPDFAVEYPGVPFKAPVGIASQLILYNQPFISNGTFTDDFKNAYPVVQKGILISEKEYDDLKLLYEKIYDETKPYNENFSSGQAIRKYLSLVINNTNALEGPGRSKIKKKSMAYSTALITGFDNSGEALLANVPLLSWKSPKIVPEEVTQNYFKQFSTLSGRLLENKNNPNIIILQNDEKFYWLNSYFMPMIKPIQTLQK